MGKLFAGLGAGSGMAAAAVVTVVLVGLAGWIQYGRSTGPEATPATAVKPEVADQPTAEPATTETAEPAAAQPNEAVEAAESPSDEDRPTDQAVEETAAAQPQEEIATPAPVPPAFDEVRREADGAMVIAGRALPGAEVKILQDGEQIALTTADGSGKFAAFATVPPDGKGHVLSLLQTTAEGALASDEQIILAPLAAPVVVAEAQETPPAQEVAVDEDVSQVAEATTEVQVAEVAATEPDSGEETTVADVADATEPDETESVSAAEASADQSQEPATVADTDPAEPAEKVEEDVVVAALAPQEAETAPEATELEAPADAPEAAPESDAGADTASGAAEPATDAPQQPATTVAEVAETDETANPTQVAQPSEEPVRTAQPAETVAAANEPAQTAEPAVADTTVAENNDAEATDAPAETSQPARVAVLKTTEEGVELLNPDAPEVMDNVAIDTISYSDTGAVELAGRAQLDTRNVRVYLDNTSVASLPVDAAGNWRGSLPQVDEGIYKLRVDEVAADGTVTSRVETPFKREDPAVLAAASAEQDGPIKAITVQKGATLWAIARDRYGKGELYVRVFEANRASIRDPDLIYPGQIFDLPD